MARNSHPWILKLCAFFAVLCCCEATYRIGVGISDVTGPIAEVVFMGYAKSSQKGCGIHLRQWSRAFILQDGEDRIVFASVDVGMIGQGLRKAVLNQLSKLYGNTYTEQNVILSGTHTHSAPGGFLMDLLFDLSSFGFVKETFRALVTGITKSIVQAHNSMVEGKVYLTSGELLNVNINRSPTSYLANPKEERDRYQYDVDKEMVQLRFVSDKNKPLGVINWYAVHPTSMNNTNHLVSSDNMGYAALLFEKAMNPNSLPGHGSFVAAFASSNLGDVSPNIRGARCLNTGLPCDMHTSSCNGDAKLCFASGPGKDMTESTKIIGERLAGKAQELWNKENAKEITGPLKIVHRFVDMPEQEVDYVDPKTKSIERVKGCLPAMGYSFAAGTTDGPGEFDFKQGMLSDNPLWNMARDFLSKPTSDQKQCQHPKPILIPSGQMSASSKTTTENITFPYEWQPRIVSTQLAMIGSVILAAVPGEFTTMSGRRLRDALKEVSIQNGGSNDTKVIIAGLSNVYSDYITTPEEYKVQRYEGASTVFGPHTLTIYLEIYRNLTTAAMTNTPVDPGPTPPGFKNLISLIPPVLFDLPGWRKDFGDCIEQPAAYARPGDTVKAKFIAGHPRNNLMHGKTFLAVEKSVGPDEWKVIATDGSWETRYIWERISTFTASSVATVQWDIGPDIEPGEYRLRHYGHYKYILGGIFPYEGLSESFQVI